MQCPECGGHDFKVVDSRDSGDAIRRRRECLSCGARFTTHERIEVRHLWVLKKSGHKEPFSKQKLQEGLAHALRKRPVPASQLDNMVNTIVRRLEERREATITSESVGAVVMDVLRDEDEVAYVRFASVYQAFESVEQFIDAIKPLRMAE